MAKSSLDNFLIKIGSLEKLAVTCSVSFMTVYKWVNKAGIPQKYWPTLEEVYDLTPAEIYSINKAVWAKKK